MRARTAPQRPQDGPEFERFVRVIHEHVLLWVRDKRTVHAVAQRLGITAESALALAIASQAFEEFVITFNPN